MHAKEREQRFSAACTTAIEIGWITRYELGRSCSGALADALAHALVHALKVKIAFRSTAATLQIAFVLIIVHKGSADPLLPSLSARVVVAYVPVAIGSGAWWPMH